MTLVGQSDEVDLFFYSLCEQFLQRWNRHTLSSEHNMTPVQLYFLDLMERQNVLEPATAGTTGWQGISTSHALPNT